MLNKKGFSLIELLVAVVVIGILSALIYPKLNPVKDRTYVSTMQNSLNKLVTAEENYFDVSNTFVAPATCTSIGATQGCGTLQTTTGYVPDNDVSVAVTASTNAKYGFKAIASHGKSAAQCGIAYGSSGPGGTEYSGKVVCAAAGSLAATAVN